MTAQHSINGRIGAAERWGRTTAEQRERATRAAREALAERFERLADPDGVMNPADRARAAEHLKRAHMLRMSKAAADARRLRAGATKTA